MAANANMEVDMPSAMQTISPFFLSYSQNCTSKCCEGGRRGRFRRTVDLMGRTAKANRRAGTDNGDRTTGGGLRRDGLRGRQALVNFSSH